MTISQSSLPPSYNQALQLLTTSCALIRQNQAIAGRLLQSAILLPANSLWLRTYIRDINILNNITKVHIRNVLELSRVALQSLPADHPVRVQANRYASVLQNTHSLILSSPLFTSQITAPSIPPQTASSSSSSTFAPQPIPIQPPRKAPSQSPITATIQIPPSQTATTITVTVSSQTAAPLPSTSEEEISSFLTIS